MNILFLGSVCPRERESEVMSNSLIFDVPANTLQWALLSGFDKFADVNIVSSMRLKYKVGSFVGTNFSHKEGANDFCISTPNNLYLKKMVDGKRIINAALSMKIEPDVIFIYSYNLPRLKAAYTLKRKFPNSKVVLLVTDLAEFMNSYKGVKSLLRKLEAKLCYQYIREIVDGYVLLAEAMKEKLPVGNKPFMVMEGIFNNNDTLKGIEKDSNKVVLYTGNLGRRYGIEDLLKGFVKIDNPNYRLWLCGAGDSEDLIQILSKEDSRIKYWGIIKREHVLELQKKATVLVNPRHSNEEYTKYSFPSKTMEYMASGTPTLMCSLASLPESYKKHLYIFEDETPEGMAKKIVDVCEKTQEELAAFGNAAAEFILKEKNQYAQCKNIIEFIRNI